MVSLDKIKSSTNVNRLLAGLSRRDREQVLAGCTLVQLTSGMVLVEAGHPMAQVYFPIGCTICLTTPTESGTQLGVSLIGNEGMLGSTLTTGVASLLVQASVQESGEAWRISRNKFLLLLVAMPTLRRRISSYLHLTLDYLIRKPTCCQFHLLEARLAFWLLMMHDRVDDDFFEMTHQMLADLLGVRRVGITLAARALQARGLISYRRGDITILDRKALITAACSCYGVTETAYERLLG